MITTVDLAAATADRTPQPGDGIEHLILKLYQQLSGGTKSLGNSGKLPGFAVYGQSLAAGFGANEAGTTSAASARHLMFNAGTRAFSYESPLAPSNHVNLVPLLESISGDDGETILTTMLRVFEDRVLQKYGVTIPPCVGASIPRSGQPIASFVQGQYIYNRVLDFATALSRLGGQLAALIWIQGENSNLAADRAGYPATWLDIMSDLRTDTGVDFPVFGYQTSGGVLASTAPLDTSGATLAQWDMFQAGNYNLVTPIYFMPDNASIHINALGQKWLGAYFGRALADYYFGGTIRKPLYPTAVEIESNICTITYAGNEGQLVLDTTNFYAVTATTDGTVGPATVHTKLGFQLISNGAPVVITDTPTVVGTNQVQFTCPGGLVNPVVRYACSARFPNFNEPPKGAGNLHDSSPDRVILDGRTYPLHNWSVHFDWTV